MRQLLCLLAGFIFMACSSRPVPDGIIPPEKMEKVVYDLMQVDEFINNFVYKDSSIDIKKQRSIYYEQVFKIHNTTRKDFFTSFKYYEQRPEIQKTLFDSLYNSASRKKVEPLRKPLKPL